MSAVFIILVCAVRFNVQDTSIAKKTDQYFRTELQVLKGKLNEFNRYCRQGAARKILRQQFIVCRLAYKRLAVLSEYFNIYESKFLNGPALNRVEEGAPDLIILDTTDPARPRARPLSAALARIVRARAVNPRFIAGQLRHGPRGAAELAETVDRLVDFAQTTGAVASRYFDLLHEAYVADDAVRDFIVRENPAAGAAIAARLDTARRRGLWHPRRNDVDAGLAALMKEGAR